MGLLPPQDTRSIAEALRKTSQPLTQRTQLCTEAGTGFSQHLTWSLQQKEVTPASSTTAIYPPRSLSLSLPAGHIDTQRRVPKVKKIFLTKAAVTTDVKKIFLTKAAVTTDVKKILLTKAAVTTDVKKILLTKAAVTTDVKKILLTKAAVTTDVKKILLTKAAVTTDVKKILLTKAAVTTDARKAATPCLKTGSRGSVTVSELRKLKPSLRHEQRRAILDKQANKQTNKQGQR
ncbi:hypothetical protein O3P69_011802 [Scylla paramamosain]|uniref:Uncharacterized protein n=1 Tax=Scylla paramamosain TaxID=85552 RepID=A0AAW0SHB8_SCYPA